MGLRRPPPVWPFIIGSAVTSAGLGILMAKEANRIRLRHMQEAKVLANKWAGVFPRVSPETVLTIIGIESSFKSDAVNTNDRAMARGGAWGYMQMTLDTAIDLMPQMPKALAVIGKWNGTGASLLDPDLNVALGTFYLDRLAREFKDFDLTVAAYQQGPGNIRKSMAAGLSKAQILERLGEHGKQYVLMAQAMRDKIREGTV